MNAPVTAPLKIRHPRLLALSLGLTLTLLVTQAALAAPLTFTKGTYNGLFYPGDGTNQVIAHLSSGFLTVRVSESGAFSGAIYTSPTASFPGLKHALSGQFDGEGKKTLTLASKAGFGDVLTLQLQYAADGQTEAITGQVSCANWTAQALAFPAYSSQPPQAGMYTCSLAKPAADPGPEGLGVGKVSVSLAGKLAFAGKLPDGTAFTQSLALCQEGRWPLFASLYSGSGSIVGWVEFNGGSSFSGAVGWTKPALPKAKYYHQGLTNVMEMTGLPFTPTRTRFRPLNFKQGLVVFSGGGLTTPFTNAVNLNASGRVSDTTASRLSFKINRFSGQFTGSAALPGIKGSVPLRGAIFQNPLNQGLGYFLHNGQSGSVQFYGDYR